MEEFMKEHPEVAELAKDFHLMWDNFPGLASLVHKSKRVVAANEIAQSFGRKPGVFCIKLGDPQSHVPCLANECLKEGKPKVLEKTGDYGVRLVHWQPIDGYPDYYVHYSVTLND